MKWFTLLFGLYMTILAIMPCKDKEDVLTIRQTTVSTGQYGDPGSCDEACPPFCTCNCCSNTRVLARSYVVLSPIEQSVARDYSELRVEPLRDQSIPIWQPPQLS